MTIGYKCNDNILCWQLKIVYLTACDINNVTNSL